jgi:hypothetical protein
MRFFNFSEFTVEKLGVSEPSIQFIDILEQKCYNDFLEFFESDLNTLDSTKTGEVEVMPYSKIKTYIKDRNIYKEFPVVGFEFIYLFKKLPDPIYVKKYPDITSVGGWLHRFGNKNWKWSSKMVDPVKNITKKGLIIQIGIEIFVNKDKFNISDPNEKLKDDIGSTLWHELNHAFEHYQRTIKKNVDYKNIQDKSFNTALTYASFTNKQRFPKDIWDFWYQYFLYFIYKSESFELRADVQEIGYFLKKYPKKSIEEFKIYKDAKEMESFDPFNFYHKLIKRISEYVPYKGIEKQVAEKLKNMWLNVYKEELKSQKGSPIIPITTLEKMDCLEFIRYWGKAINENGTYIKRKFIN